MCTHMACIEAQNGPIFGHRSLKVSFPLKRKREVGMSAYVPGIETDVEAVLGNCTIKIALLHQLLCEMEMAAQVAHEIVPSPRLSA